MATNTDPRARGTRLRRRHRSPSWLLPLIARTVAAIIVMLVARALGLPSCGGH